MIGVGALALSLSGWELFRSLHRTHSGNELKHRCPDDQNDDASVYDYDDTPGTEAHFEECISACCGLIMDHLESVSTASVMDIHYLDFTPWRRKIIRAAFDDLEKHHLIQQVASLELENDYQVKYQLVQNDYQVKYRHVQTHH